MFEQIKSMNVLSDLIKDEKKKLADLKNENPEDKDLINKIEIRIATLSRSYSTLWENEHLRRQTYYGGGDYWSEKKYKKHSTLRNFL